MKKQSIVRLGAVGAVVATTGVMAAGSIVGASPYSYTSDNMGSDNQNSRWDSGNNNSGNSGRWQNGSGWNRLEPMTYMSNNSNATYASWKYEATSKVSSYSVTNWQSDGSNSSWTPSGDNWQADWSNWNPAKWERNGSSYDNWYSQVSSYMASSSVSIESEFSSNSSSSNSSSSGDSNRSDNYNNQY